MGRHCQCKRTASAYKEKRNESAMEKGIFGRTEILFGWITGTNTTEGATWRRDAEDCISQSDGDQDYEIIYQCRTERQTMERCTAYTAGGNTHIANLESHLTGYIGEQCRKAPIGKQGKKYGTIRSEEIKDKTKKENRKEREMEKKKVDRK